MTAADSSATWRSELATMLSEHLELLGVGVVLVESGGRVLDADAAALRIFDRTAEQMTSVGDVAVLLAPEERHKRTAYRERRRRNETNDEPRGERFGTIVLRPDGSRVPVELVIVPLRDGAVTAILVRDLSDLASRDQVIDWYAALVERMPIGVVIMDATGAKEPRDIRLWSANDAASVAARRDLTEYHGQRLDDLFPAARRFDEARRALALRGSRRIDHLPDWVIGDPDRPEAVYRRTLLGLPEGAVGLLLDDITRDRLDEVERRQLTERIIQISDAERRHIAMGIHDDPIQQIAAAALLVAQLRRKGGVMRDDWLEQVEVALQKGIRSLRQLVFDLIPPELVESGLESAIRSVADQLFSDTSVRVDVRCELADEPPHAIQSTAFRIVAEALRNVRQHAEARQVTVRSAIDADELVIEVTDDGDGIRSAAKPGHIGMRSMHDRAGAVGGSLDVTSSSAGTTVVARLPTEQQPLAVAFEPVTIRRPDTTIESLRLERDSLRASHVIADRIAGEAQRRLTSVVELGAALRDLPPDRTQRLDAAVRYIAAAVADGCAIRLIDADRTMLERVASWHPDPDQLAFLDEWLFRDRPVGTSHSVLAFESSQPMLIDRARVGWLPSDGPVPPPAPHEPHTAIVAPLRLGQTSIGVLTVVRDVTPDRLTVTDLGWVAALADVTTTSIAL